MSNEASSRAGETSDSAKQAQTSDVRQRPTDAHKVVVFGIGRGAHVATRYFREDSAHEVVGYTVDDAYAQQSEFMGRPVIPFSRIEHELPPNEVRMFIPLGFQRMNALRAKKFDEAGKKGYSFASYVSSRICAVEYPQIGENCLILEANVFNYDVTIGNDVVIWSGNHVGDLCVIEDHVWISSHAVLSGEVTIGSHTFVGVNASVSNYVKIGPRSYIGACALITQDTAPDSVYVDKATPKLGIDSQRFLGMTKS